MANSERYIVCDFFKKRDIRKYHGSFIGFLNLLSENTDGNFHILRDLKSIMKLNVPLLFYNQLEEINSEIGQKQINNINQTIKLFNHDHGGNYSCTGTTYENKLIGTNIKKSIQWCIDNNIPYNNLKTNAVNIFNGVQIDNSRQYNNIIRPSRMGNRIGTTRFSNLKPSKTYANSL